MARKKEEMRAIIGSEERLNIGEVYHCDNWSFKILRISDLETFTKDWGKPDPQYKFFYEVEAAQ